MAAQHTILVVDDDPEVCALVRDLLERAGYVVVTASDGQEAIDVVARDESVAAVVSDIVMPGLGGPAAAETYTRIRPDLPVIYISSYMPPAPREPSRALRKPFRATELLAKLRAALGETS